MTPNNKLYRRILQALDTQSEYARFYSSLYYMKRIAMQYGATYTGCHCSNKYLKDWAELVGVQLDGKHHTNNWYLRRIALKISGLPELEHNTDNYCLSLILENITPPTPQPTATQLKVYINDVEIDTSQTPPTTILSYADGDSADFKFLALDENDDPVENYAVTVTQGDNTYNLSTNSSGIATYSYSSQGIGDTTVVISSSLVSEIYDVQDMFKYDDATSDKSSKFSFISNPSSSSISHQTDYYQVNYSRAVESNPVKINLAEFVCEDDFEASMDVYYTALNPKQFTWKISGNSNFNYDNMSEIGTWSSSKIFRTFVGTQSYAINPTGQLPQSTWLILKFKKQNGIILLQAYDGSTLIDEHSSVGWEQSTTIIMGLQISEYISTLRFRNLKIKRL